LGPWATANYCRAGIKSLRATPSFESLFQLLHRAYNNLFLLGGYIFLCFRVLTYFSSYFLAPDPAAWMRPALLQPALVGSLRLHPPSPPLGPRTSKEYQREKHHSDLFVRLLFSLPWDLGLPKSIEERNTTVISLSAFSFPSPGTKDSKEYRKEKDNSDLFARLLPTLPWELVLPKSIEEINTTMISSPTSSALPSPGT
jgi:hypothetical protein